MIDRDWGGGVCENDKRGYDERDDAVGVRSSPQRTGLCLSCFIKNGANGWNACLMNY